MVFLMRAAGHAPAGAHTRPLRGAHTRTRAHARAHTARTAHTRTHAHTHTQIMEKRARGRAGGMGADFGGAGGTSPRPSPRPPAHTPLGGALTRPARPPPHAALPHAVTPHPHSRTHAPHQKDLEFAQASAHHHSSPCSPHPHALFGWREGGTQKRGRGTCHQTTHARNHATHAVVDIKILAPRPPPPPSGRLLELLFTPTSGRSARPGRRRAGSSPTRCRTRRQP